jgi:hypothetical protein
MQSYIQKIGCITEASFLKAAGLNIIGKYEDNRMVFIYIGSEEEWNRHINKLNSGSFTVDAKKGHDALVELANDCFYDKKLPAVLDCDIPPLSSD